MLLWRKASLTARINIEVFYNRSPRHSTLALGCKSPIRNSPAR